jgi:hypothetical protein
MGSQLRSRWNGTRGLEHPGRKFEKINCVAKVDPEVAGQVPELLREATFTEYKYCDAPNSRRDRLQGIPSPSHHCIFHVGRMHHGPRGRRFLEGLDSMF